MQMRSFLDHTESPGEWSVEVGGSFHDDSDVEERVGVCIVGVDWLVLCRRDS